MSVPPDEPADPGEPTETPPDFDPYRFGKPDHPIPPEYAPPGYVPPAVTEPPPPGPAYGTPAYPPPPSYEPPPPYGTPPGYPGYPPAGPPGYPPVPPQFHPDYPQPRTSNGRAIASMVLGIVSILLCWASFFDAIPIALAVIFGFTARAQAKRDPRTGGSGMALAGIICGAAGAVLAIILTVVIVHITHACSGIDTGSSAYTNCVRDHL